MRHQRFACAHLLSTHLTFFFQRLFSSRSLPTLFTLAALDGLKPTPAGRLREAFSHLYYSSTEKFLSCVRGTHPSGTFICSLQFLDSILAIHVCIIFGLVLNEIIKRSGLDLPLFVTCLFAGILVTNIMPRTSLRLSRMPWPSRTPTMALIAEVSLGSFLAMSLMSMQLWTLVEVAGPIVAILTVQFLFAIAVNIFVVFPALGRTYDAAVVSAGFGGISMGSTPTAMANMSAVASRYGASHLAFVIVPLVCAFFIDLVNAMLIPAFLSFF